jgi:hypothetical protein
MTIVANEYSKIRKLSSGLEMPEGTDLGRTSQLFVYSPLPARCKCSFAKSKYDTCVVPEAVLVVITSRNEGTAETGEQVIHLEWAKRYRFAQSNVEPPPTAMAKALLLGPTLAPVALTKFV